MIRFDEHFESFKANSKMRLLIFNFLVLATMITTHNVANGQPVESPLYYLTREPKIHAEHPPVIILLHGVGSNEKDLFSFASQLPDKFLVISARAPIAVGKDSYAWYQLGFSNGKPVINHEQEENSKDLIIRFINYLKEKYSVDEKQVYLCGFSQGAIMSYAVGLTNPDKIKGIAAMSGRILDEVRPFIPSNEKLQHLNIFISHGTDDGVLTVQYAHEAVALLEHLKLIPTYREYPAGHTINNEMFHDLVNWLGSN